MIGAGIEDALPRTIDVLEIVAVTPERQLRVVSFSTYGMLERGMEHLVFYKLNTNC